MRPHCEAGATTTEPQSPFIVAAKRRVSPHRASLGGHGFESPLLRSRPFRSGLFLLSLGALSACDLGSDLTPELTTIGTVDEDDFVPSKVRPYEAAQLFRELSDPTYKLLDTNNRETLSVDVSSVTARINEDTGKLVFSGFVRLKRKDYGIVPLLFTLVATEEDGNAETKTIAINVKANDDRPLRTNSEISFRVQEDIAITNKSRDLKTLFTDPEFPDGRKLTFNIYGQTSDLGVEATIGSDNKVTLSGIPDNLTETRSVVFTVSASDGPNSTSPYRITVTIEADNDELFETSSTLSFRVTEQVAITGEIGTLRTLFTDPEGEPLNFAFIGAEALSNNQQARALGVTATIGTDNRVTLSGTPDNLIRTDKVVFTVTASDGFNSSEPYRITITIDADNDKPARTSSALSFRVTEQVAITSEVGSLSALFTDPEGADLSFAFTGSEAQSDNQQARALGVTAIIGTDDQVTLSGTPDNVSVTRNVTFSVTATDDGDNSSEPYLITVTIAASTSASGAAANAAPEIVGGFGVLVVRNAVGATFDALALDAAEHFTDDGGAANLILSIEGFDGTASNHGISSVSLVGGTTLSIGGEFADGTVLGSMVEVTLVATDASGLAAKKTLRIEAAAPPTTMTISDGGISILPIGDIDKDGFDDFFWIGQGTFLKGAALLASSFMSSGAISVPDLADKGSTIFSVGDVNADGRADLINYYHSRQDSFLLLGSDTARVPVVLSGFKASRVDFADLNGDGIDDVLLGWVGEDHNSANFGSATLARSGIDLANLGSAGATINGITDSSFGEAVASAGDVNGDGIDDMIIGASLEGSQLGAAYVLYGGSALATGFAGDAASDREVLGALGARGFALSADTDNTGDVWLGNSVSGGGDFNGDGLADVIIGAPSTDDNSSSS